MIETMRKIEYWARLIWRAFFYSARFLLQSLRKNEIISLQMRCVRRGNHEIISNETG